MFLIVEFPDTNEVELAPSSWINVDDGTCKWPPYKPERLTKAISNREAPGSGWTVFNARVIKEFRE
jgi:hypothetical protein